MVTYSLKLGRSFRARARPRPCSLELPFISPPGRGDGPGVTYLRALPRALGRFMVHLYDRCPVKLWAGPAPAQGRDLKPSCLKLRNTQKHIWTVAGSGQRLKGQLPPYQGIRTHLRIKCTSPRCL